MTERLVIQSMSADLHERLCRVARTRGQGLNELILETLEAAVERHGRHTRLQTYATWGPDQLAEFDSALRAQRRRPELGRR